MNRFLFPLVLLVALSSIVSCSNSITPDPASRPALGSKYTFVDIRYDSLGHETYRDTLTKTVVATNATQFDTANVIVLVTSRNDTEYYYKAWDGNPGKLAYVSTRSGTEIGVFVWPIEYPVNEQDSIIDVTDTMIDGQRHYSRVVNSYLGSDVLHTKKGDLAVKKIRVELYSTIDNVVSSNWYFDVWYSPDLNLVVREVNPTQHVGTLFDGSDEYLIDY